MYISMDIETTGLTSDRDLVLEMVAVLLPEGESDPTAVCEFPYFHRIIRHERLEGSPVALSMNARLLGYLSELAKREYEEDHVQGLRWCWPKDFGLSFSHWLTNQGIVTHRSLHALGQNVAAFDMKFLQRVQRWPQHLFHYRCLEVGSLFATRYDCPSLSAVAEALGFEIPGNPHEALYDARVALACAMQRWNDNASIR